MSDLIRAMSEHGAETDKTLERFMGNTDLYEKFLKKFCEGTDVDELEKLVSEKDWEQAVVSAHTLKGVAGNLGLTKLFETFSDMVVKLRAGDTDIADDMAVARSEYDEVKRIVTAS